MNLDIIRNRLNADREIIQMSEGQKKENLMVLAFWQSIWDRETLLTEIARLTQPKVVEK